MLPRKWRIELHFVFCFGLAFLQRNMKIAYAFISISYIRVTFTHLLESQLWCAKQLYFQWMTHMGFKACFLQRQCSTKRPKIFLIPHLSHSFKLRCLHHFDWFIKFHRFYSLVNWGGYPWVFWVQNHFLEIYHQENKKNKKWQRKWRANMKTTESEFVAFNTTNNWKGTTVKIKITIKWRGSLFVSDIYLSSLRENVLGIWENKE